MLQWLKQKLGAEPPRRVPTMFRVRDAAGETVPQVDLHCVFTPNQTEKKVRKITASGLCILHWPKGSRHVRVQVKGPRGGAAEVEVAVDRPDPDRVIEVQLGAVG